MDGGKTLRGVYFSLVLTIIVSCPPLPLLLMRICHYGHSAFHPSVGTPLEFMPLLLHELANQLMLVPLIVGDHHDSSNLWSHRDWVRSLQTKLDLLKCLFVCLFLVCVKYLLVPGFGKHRHLRGQCPVT